MDGSIAKHNAAVKKFRDTEKKMQKQMKVSKKQNKTDIK